MKKGIALYCIAGLFGLGYLYWTEARIANLQKLNDLVYDASTCCEKGKGEKEVRSCLDSYGYVPWQFDAKSDMVDPDLYLGGWTLRHSFLEIDYDPKGKVECWHLRSIYSSL